VATMIGCLPTQALAFLAVFVYATHATQAIAFGWKPGLSKLTTENAKRVDHRRRVVVFNEAIDVAYFCAIVTSLWTVSVTHGMSLGLPGHNYYVGRRRYDFLVRLFVCLSVCLSVCLFV